MRLHHIGIATERIEETKDYCKRIFQIKEETNIIYDPNQNARLCMLTMDDGTMIELIEGERVQKFVKKRQYLYHLCYEVKDIDDSIERFRKEKDMVIMRPTEAVLFGNRKVAFLFTKVGIVELLEE